MERLNRLKGLAILAVPLSLLGVACGGDTDASGDVPGPKEVVGESDENKEPTVISEYYRNGNRILRYQDEDGYFADIFQFCDGNDLVEQTEFLKYGYGAAGNSIERSVDHPACDDGRLTPSDFQVEG